MSWTVGLDSKQHLGKPVLFVHSLLYYSQVCELLSAVSLSNLNSKEGGEGGRSKPKYQNSCNTEGRWKA